MFLTEPRNELNMAVADAPNYCIKYDITQARKNNSPKKPVSHQSEALKKLSRWYESHPKPHAGAILVLPTGGGKTFTAIHFLCKTVLSEGYKVLWLAHTHHLLEQAFEDLEKDLGQIAEPRRSLKVRVVSGTKDHYPVQSIKSDDDVVIATLQTISNAHKEKNKFFESFLKSAGEKLFVIFDEAHHAPAPSYRKLIQSLRERIPNMYVLGMTATPTYTDKSRSGWFSKLFPQGIVYQVTPQELMAQGILAEPVTEPYKTKFEPDFDESEYQKWIETFKDIPEYIIKQMAENEPRNEYIGSTYVNNREKYGKTIIFTDRWHQCESISKYLENRGVRAGSVYSHVVKGSSKKTADENNKRVLEEFKAGKLDVILNVQMLTEGTDVPDAESVFITRQTTSQNLLTQMVGRALRGPKFGGTEKAYLVFFIDKWQRLINWAEYEMPDGITGPPKPKPGERPPLQYISIELVRKLAVQMDSGLNFNTTPFLQLLPIGWYLVDYTAQLNGSDDLEPIKRLVMVFDHEKSGYVALIDDTSCRIKKTRLAEFEDENVQFEKVSDIIGRLRTRFFPDSQNHFGTNIDQDIFSILRHMEQNNSPPKFFPFNERDNHDLDLIAKKLVNKSMTDIEKNEILKEEYNRNDRYWKVIYPLYENFKSHYDGCINRILKKPQNDDSTYKEPGDEKPVELADEIKRQVKERDGYKCLCCGTTNRRFLQVDHIEPKRVGGSNDLNNLQTLCGECNNRKRIDTINFRDHRTKLTKPPNALPNFKVPTYLSDGDLGRWIEFAYRTINFFYQCSAVKRVMIREIGYYSHQWQVQLHNGNNPKWLEPHLPELLARIRNAGNPTRYKKLNEIIALPQESTSKDETAKEMNFVGSKDSSKYHHPSCGWAKRIPPKDRIYFPSTEAAKNYGYSPCKVCKPTKMGKQS